MVEVAGARVEALKCRRQEQTRWKRIKLLMLEVVGVRRPVEPNRIPPRPFPNAGKRLSIILYTFS